MARSRSHRRSRDDDFIATPVLRVRPSWVSHSLAINPVHDSRLYRPDRELLGPLEETRVVQPSSWSSQVRSARVDHIQSRRSYSHRVNRFGDVLQIARQQRAIPVFVSPEKVPVCVRRKRRRAVLFAKGKGGRGFRKPRWTQRSYERCR